LPGKKGIVACLASSVCDATELGWLKAAATLGVKVEHAWLRVERSKLEIASADAAGSAIQNIIGRY